MKYKLKLLLLLSLIEYYRWKRPLQWYTCSPLEGGIPLHSWMASPWTLCEVVSEMDNPIDSVLVDSQFNLMVSTFSWPDPPKRTTMSTNLIQAAWEAFWFEARFVPPAILSSWPWVTDASWVVNFLRGEMAVTFKATGLPFFQKERYRLAWRELTPRINDDTSFFVIITFYIIIIVLRVINQNMHFLNHTNKPTVIHVCEASMII